MKKPNFKLWRLSTLIAISLIFTILIAGYGSSKSLTSENLIQVLESEIGDQTNFEGIQRFPLVLTKDEISSDLFQSLKDIASASGHKLYNKEHTAVVYFVGDDNLTRGMIKRGMLQTMARIDYYAFLNFDSLNHLFIYPRFPMQDQYGNTKMTIVGIQYLYRNTATKFNWDTVIRSLPGKLKQGSDYFGWDPSF